MSEQEAIYVKSKNNIEYLVQNVDDKEIAVTMLDDIRSRIFRIRDYLAQNKNKYPAFASYIEQFCDRIDGVILLENPPDGEYTSYTLNKGEEIALCLRSKKTNKLHDINLIMYVVLHELSHVACPEQDHTELFKKIFVFFLGIAVQLNIYTNTDYILRPHEYCGLTINENLLRT